MQVLENSRPAATAEALPDKDITDAIELFFVTRKGVVANQIGVTTKAGIVVLTGQTTSLLARDRAEEIALAVRGVRGVVNELTVHTADVPDEQLQLDVARALAHDAAARDYNLRCTAHQGLVTLTGVVQSWAEKQLALRVVRGVRGVRAVADERLAVRLGARLRADADLTAQLQEMLDWDIRVNPHLLRVRTTDGVVHLSGTVASAEEKTRLLSMAYQAGASRVEATEVHVAPWAQEPGLRRHKYVPRTDEEVTQAVRDTLQRDPRTHTLPVAVRVRDGAVTLDGVVSSFGASEAAEQDARHVVGVWQVKNHLKVRPADRLPDADIRQYIEQALARDPYMSTAGLTVAVLEGKAHLYGQVTSQFEQEQAWHLAAYTNGVVAVESHLVLKPAEPQAAPLDAASLSADQALAEAIRSRCYWTASLHDEDLEVQVTNGRATLSGTVDTWLERQLAVQAAAEAGAREIDNQLCVAELSCGCHA